MTKKFFAAMALVLASQAALADGTVTLKNPVTFNEDADIPKSILEECNLGDELSAAITASSKENGITVATSGDATATIHGRALELEIYEAVADGNAFMGHHKSMGVKGKLFEDGQQIGNFKDRRISMGGALGQFKGSCSVLVRIAKEMGDDIGEWLKEPTKNAKLGDLE